jgi:hypothetical protein
VFVVKRLNLKSEKLSLADFNQFIMLLDEVLVDESGNILSDGGIDLDSIDSSEGLEDEE